MRRLLALTCCLAPAVLVAVVVPLAFDPLRLFADRTVERDIAAEMNAGHDLVIAVRYDERRVNAERIAGRDAAPDTVVLGTSRTRGISACTCAPHSLQNHSVPRGTLEDAIATYGMYRSRGILPATVLIGADPWTLNRDHGEPGWRSVSPPYATVRRMLGPDGDALPAPVPFADTLARFRTLVSPAAARLALAALWNRVTGGPFDLTFLPVRGAEVRGQLTRADGSYRDPLAWLERPQADVDRDARTYATRRPVFQLSGFRHIDTDYARALGAFLDLLQSDGVTPVLILVPIHPVAWDLLAASSDIGPVTREAEATLRTLASERDIRLIGSYDPRAVGWTSADFLDAVHPRDEAIARLVRPLCTP